MVGFSKFNPVPRGGGGRKSTMQSFFYIIFLFGGGQNRQITLEVIRVTKNVFGRLCVFAPLHKCYQWLPELWNFENKLKRVLEKSTTKMYWLKQLLLILYCFQAGKSLAIWLKYFTIYFIFIIMNLVCPTFLCFVVYTSFIPFT